MTQPPYEGLPGIPGSSGFGSPPPRGTEPTFLSPAPAAAPMSAAFELASWGARFAAQLLDGLFRMVIAVAIGVGGFVLLADRPFSFATDLDESSSFPPPGYDSADFNALWLILTVLVIYFALALLYAPLFMARWRGATPGKRMLGIRVVNEEGTDVSFGKAFLREPICKGLVVGAIGGTVVFAPLLNYLWPLWDRECRAGHDFMAKTRVVRAR